MAMAMMPVYSLKHFTHVLEAGHAYPFLGVLLYSPLNGLDERMRNYVRSRWRLLNSLTGDSCLLLAVEDIEAGQPIDEFKPEEIYAIARELGASVGDVPGIIFFTDPKARNDTLVLRLREFLPPPREIEDDDLTDFFRSVSAILDRCAEKPAFQRLDCLREGLSKEWPGESRWSETASQAHGWILASASTAATVAQSLTAVIGVLKVFGVGG